MAGVLCPKCGVPYGPAETLCPRDGTPRPGVQRAVSDDEETITRSVSGPPEPISTRTEIARPAALPPMLDEEPRTEQVDASGLRVPKISLQPQVQAVKRIPGIPMHSQPSVPAPAPAVAPRIAPSTPGGAAVRRTSTPSLPQLEPPTAGSTDPLIGQKVGDYLIQTQIGVGGMGVVYRGVQPLIGAPVAIKVLRPEAASDPQQVQRLLSEARVVNAIRHRGIVDIFNFASLPDGRHCVVMEYLHGKSLEDALVKRPRLPLAEALPLFEEVLAALAAAHKAGVIHRDIKPSNIFIVEEHGKTYAKILDFGIAKQSYAPDGLVAQTVMTRFMGTPGFVAPEQARAQPVGPLTDLYALGVVMFITLTGKPPFEADTPYELVKKHVELPVPSASRIEPSIPATLDRLLMSMMAKSPAERPQSAELVREQLERIRLSLAGRTASGNTRKPDVGDEALDGPNTQLARVPRMESGRRKAVTPGAAGPALPEDADVPSPKFSPLKYIVLGVGVAILAAVGWFAMHH